MSYPPMIIFMPRHWENTVFTYNRCAVRSRQWPKVMKQRKRQTFGDEIDFDALVEASVDRRQGPGDEREPLQLFPQEPP